MLNVSTKLKQAASAVTSLMLTISLLGATLTVAGPRRAAVQTKGDSKPPVVTTIPQSEVCEPGEQCGGGGPTPAPSPTFSPTPTPGPSACSEIAFAPPTNFPAGNNPISVATGDFNGDGDLDLASANYGSGSVSVLLGDGAGGFAPAASFPAGGGPFSVATGDLNADGRLDLAVANYNSGSLSILLGNGAGGFAMSATVYADHGRPISVATGDFNADGRLDLATANWDPYFFGFGSLSVWYGNGAGGVVTVTNLSVGTNPTSVTTGDFDGDGRLDLAAANYDSGNISVLRNFGFGFAAATSFGAGTNPFYVTTGDFNADGRLDLATANYDSDNISVLIGNGFGGFVVTGNFPAGDWPRTVATGDFNADGKLDLAAANSLSDDVSVLLGNGVGGFAAASNFGVGGGPYSVATGDFNADGKLDLAAANHDSGNISVLLNSCGSNSAPVANTDSHSTNEDTLLSGSSVLANDTDGEDDSLTAVLVAGPVNALAFTLNANGTFSYTPKLNFNGSDSFTYVAHDGLLDSNDATVTITVNPVNDAPVVSATPKMQPDVQYSDSIQAVTIIGSDVDTHTGSLSISFSYVRNAESPVVGLPAGMSHVATTTPGKWIVSGTAGQGAAGDGLAAGTYVVTGTVSDGSLSASDTFTIVVTRENATVTPSAVNPASVKVNTPDGTAGPITLCADIADAADGSLGDIANAVPVTFVLTPVAPGGTLTMVDTELDGGSACVTFDDVPVNVYDVTISVGGDYYTGSVSSVLAVFDPTLGFTTGGGKVLNPSTGNVLHFGFSFKYDKKGFKGQMLVMEHLADGSVTKLKSNSLTSLSIIGNRALVLGKANMLYADGTSLGNLGFRLDVTDNGEPGSSDEFGLKTTTSDGVLIAAFSIDPRTILSGNIQVPQGAKK